ncbi:Na(+)/H(+) antiporter subunit F1 [Virgibacillus alimentarius]|uniref:Multicomponent Na+:H+ antiporter subunit F n=1 Tax=Virgibacillus alimentarius TaxID=698769 RepID=A0ABS4S856_9BACI|nr:MULTISPECIES: Na(+)/H(+) antiporter subunit F1 [Virgibacillus]MBP2256582.1 multicomponent Na+:H+ antiporter subunit F [Virgibacillus alimentarius]HLR66528.1 Na(+)/H(+) antiporter subunit F1 [Virgibacillus sp.]
MNILQFTEQLLQITVFISFIGISISFFLLLYRILIGPTNPDRAIALDLVGISLMALAALTAVFLTTTKLNDVVLLIGILSFIGTLGIAKYLEKGVIIDRDMD